MGLATDNLWKGDVREWAKKNNIEGSHGDDPYTAFGTLCVTLQGHFGDLLDRYMQRGREMDVLVEQVYRK